MHEATRLAYLDAIGIELYLPRAKLPNAAPSRVEVKDFSSSAVIESNRGRGQVSDPLISGSLALEKGIEKLFQKAPASSSDKLIAEKVAQLENVDSTRQKTAHFNLAIWQHEQYVIIDDYDPSAALPTQSLLNNILVHGLDTLPLSKGAESLRWPVAGAEENAVWDAASEMVLEFLLNRLDSSQSYTLLLFGACSCKLFLEQAEERYWQRLTRPAINNIEQVLTFDSLQNILRQPELKKSIQALLLV